MGRTIPSFRMASIEEQKEWKEFRRALDKKDRKVFDDMFSICHLYNSACSFAAKPIRIQPIFMSIIFHHYKELIEIKRRAREKRGSDVKYKITDANSELDSPFSY